jgi:hypothetical protein
MTTLPSLHAFIDELAPPPPPPLSTPSTSTSPLLAAPPLPPPPLPPPPPLHGCMILDALHARAQTGTPLLRSVSHCCLIIAFSVLLLFSDSLLIVF